jgi:Leucine Rich repeat
MAEITRDALSPQETQRPKRPIRVKLWLILVLIAVLALPMAWVFNRVRAQRLALATIQRVGGSVFYDFQEIPTGQWDPVGIKSPVIPMFLRWLPAECFEDVTLVNLQKKPIDDAGLADLSRLGRVRYLDLSDTKITDRGLAALHGYKRLKYLYLHNTPITDAGLAHLAHLDRLDNLILTGTNIGDAGLAHLQGLTSLTALGLEGTQVTDAGLAQLKTLPRLQTVFLKGTKVTPRGIEELKRSLPNLQVVP